MILPTTHASALLLLIAAFFCLGLWINTFKIAGSRWRFEHYSIDFAVGVAILSAIAAFTFGTLGPDLAFSDRLLVAGRSSQAFVVAGGFLFNLGNMLLLAAVSMLGISGAFPIALGSALIISSLFAFHTTNTLFLASGIALVLLAVLANIGACRLRDGAQRRAAQAAKATPPANATSATTQGTVKVAVKSGTRIAPKPVRQKAGRGIFIALLSGAMLGFFYPVAQKGMTGDLTVGPYAGMLMFALGILVSTVLFDFYFLNIAIDGGQLNTATYLQGKAKPHIMGLVGGALWAAGALAALLALSAPAQADISAAMKVVLPLASVLLAVACGTFAWEEFKAAPANAKVAVYLASALFASGLVLLGLGAQS